jgi:hypothetical protein
MRVIKAAMQSVPNLYQSVSRNLHIQTCRLSGTSEAIISFLFSSSLSLKILLCFELFCRKSIIFRSMEK